VSEPVAPSVSEPVALVRALWSRFQARDWVSARALLSDGFTGTWWTSGERFEGAEAYIEVQARYPEGWTIHLLECEALADGRVLSVSRVDHPPHLFYATATWRVAGDRLASVDEYWATWEAPPAWRAPEALPGCQRFDVRVDARAVVP